jgi:hypothetical protein
MIHYKSGAAQSVAIPRATPNFQTSLGHLLVENCLDTLRAMPALPNGTDLPNETIACPTGEPPPWWGGRHSGGAL